MSTVSSSPISHIRCLLSTLCQHLSPSVSTLKASCNEQHSSVPVVFENRFFLEPSWTCDGDIAQRFGCTIMNNTSHQTTTTCRCPWQPSMPRHWSHPGAYMRMHVCWSPSQGIHTWFYDNTRSIGQVFATLGAWLFNAIRASVRVWMPNSSWSWSSTTIVTIISHIPYANKAKRGCFRVTAVPTNRERVTTPCPSCPWDHQCWRVCRISPLMLMCFY